MGYVVSGYFFTILEGGHSLTRTKYKPGLNPEKEITSDGDFK
jgi:hypothetical protein